MRNLKKYAELFFAILFVCFFTQSFCYAASTDTYTDISPNLSCTNINKSWTVNFNIALNKATVNSDNIFVVDENQQKVNVNVSYGGDGKSVIVSPAQSYAVGKAYYLIVSKNVQASSGKFMTNSKRMKFVIAKMDSKTYKVCIDAGRGGSDTGAVGDGGTRECDVDLSVALKAGKILQSKGVQVYYTRTADVAVDTSSRFKTANDNNVDYFISVHCNNADNKTATGVETYYLDGNASSQKLAQDVQDNIVSYTGLRDRTAKAAPSQMSEVTSSKVPAIKTYLGFLSTPSEESVLKSDSFQNKAAQAIADAAMKNLSSGSGQNSGGNNTDVKIASIADVYDSVKIGYKYTFPQKVTAIMSDNTHQSVAVVWNSSTVDTSKLGHYNYQGTVSGYSKKVNLTLNVTDGSVIITLDPGHGGYDSGAVGPTTKEKDATLGITLKVGKYLSNNGVQVIYTRNSDDVSWPSVVVEDLQKRCDISNAAKANYFVCIHANSCDIPSVDGVETYYCDGSSDGQKLAQAIQTELLNATGLNDRKVHPDSDLYNSGLYVLRHTDATAILTEVGFISNIQDDKLLGTDAYQDKLAYAIAAGILKFIGKI